MSNFESPKSEPTNPFAGPEDAEPDEERRPDAPGPNEGTDEEDRTSPPPKA